MSKSKKVVKLKKPKILVELHRQSGIVRNLLKDQKRKARLPGKRISASGKVYWETRKNRSDLRGKNV